MVEDKALEAIAREVSKKSGVRVRGVRLMEGDRLMSLDVLRSKCPSFRKLEEAIRE